MVVLSIGKLKSLNSMVDMINKINNTLSEGEYIIRYHDDDTVTSEIFCSKGELIDYLVTDQEMFPNDNFSIYKLDKPSYRNIE